MSLSGTSCTSGRVFCTLLTYASAIFYDPETLSGIMQQLIHINPMYWYITAFRRCVLWGEGLDLTMITVCFLCAGGHAWRSGSLCSKRTRTSLSCICKGAAMDKQPIISVEHVSMRFNLAKEKHESLKEYFVALLHGGVRFDEFFALSDVSLDIMPGDFLRADRAQTAAANRRCSRLSRACTSRARAR